MSGLLPQKNTRSFHQRSQSFNCVTSPRRFYAVKRIPSCADRQEQKTEDGKSSFRRYKTMSCADTSSLSMGPSQSQPQTSQSPLKPITPVRSSTFRRHSTVSGDMLLSRKRALMLGDENFDKKGMIPLNDENNANLSIS